MKTSIIVKLQVEGTHNWPTASDFEPSMKYLEYQHRHMFHIVGKKEVFLLSPTQVILKIAVTYFFKFIKFLLI